MKEYQGQNTPGVAQRLQALRSASTPPPQELPPPSTKPAIRREFLFGGIGVVAVVALLIPLIARLQQPRLMAKVEEATNQMLQDPSNAVNSDSTSSDQSGLAEGEAYVAIPVESGHFPPQLGVGHIVRIAVTSTQDGVTASASLPGTATVQSVKSISDVSSGYVITVLTSEDVVDRIASSDSVDIAIVGEVSQ